MLVVVLKLKLKMSKVKVKVVSNVFNVLLLKFVCKMEKKKVNDVLFLLFKLEIMLLFEFKRKF